jgi:hypothetical protein
MSSSDLVFNEKLELFESISVFKLDLVLFLTVSEETFDNLDQKYCIVIVSEFVNFGVLGVNFFK